MADKTKIEPERLARFLDDADTIEQREIAHDDLSQTITEKQIKDGLSPDRGNWRKK